MSLYTSNPHPCGYFADPKHACRCSHQQIRRYRSKISGPLLDRIDIHAEVPAVPYKDLMRESNAESSAEIRKRVAAARAIQSERFARTKIYCNAQMGTRICKITCPVSKAVDFVYYKLFFSLFFHNHFSNDLALTIPRVVYRTGFVNITSISTQPFFGIQYPEFLKTRIQ